MDTFGHKNACNWVGVKKETPFEGLISNQQVQEYFKADVQISGEVGAIKKGKESEFAIALEQLDFGMCVEKLIRKLKGLEENDEKYPPNYFKKMADMMDEYLKDGEE